MPILPTTLTTKITWANPAPITYGTPLGATQLNATASSTFLTGPLSGRTESLPGTFTYSPPAGTVLNAGNQTLTVAFTLAEAQEGHTTAMHNFELGTAPGFSLLPPCRLQHLVDRRMSTGAFGLLHFGTRLLVDRFAVTRRPHATQQDLQSRDQLFARQLLGKPIGNHPRGEQLRQRSQLLLDVQEDLLHRHRLHRHVHLAGCHIGANHLKQVV